MTAAAARDGGTTIPRRAAGRGHRPLYTPAERARRDRSRWTRVQGILAPLQLLACLASAALVLHALRTGQLAAAAHASVVVKTALLYAIMVTGALWERDVYGQLLFAPAFFWEDVVSMAVIALHTAYLAGLAAAALATPWLGDRALLWLALAAYATYLVNAAQFLWKLRRARLDARRPAAEGAA